MAVSRLTCVVLCSGLILFVLGLVLTNQKDQISKDFGVALIITGVITCVGFICIKWILAEQWRQENQTGLRDETCTVCEGRGKYFPDDLHKHANIPRLCNVCGGKGYTQKAIYN